MMNPRSGGYSGGSIEGGLLAAAAVEMSRHYGLPVEASGMATDQYVPGIQTAYEHSMNGLLATLAWPDILVGCGLMGGSMSPLERRRSSSETTFDARRPAKTIPST